MQHLPKLTDYSLRTFLLRQNSETCGTIGTLSCYIAKSYLSGGKMFRRENIPLAVMSVVSLGILFVFVVAT